MVPHQIYPDLGIPLPGRIRLIFRRSEVVGLNGCIRKAGGVSTEKMSEMIGPVEAHAYRSDRLRLKGSGGRFLCFSNGAAANPVEANSENQGRTHIAE